MRRETPIQCHSAPPRPPPPPPILDRSIKEERILSAVELLSRDKKVAADATAACEHQQATRKK